MVRKDERRVIRCVRTLLSSAGDENLYVPACDRRPPKLLRTDSIPDLAFHILLPPMLPTPIEQLRVADYFGAPVRRNSTFSLIWILVQISYSASVV
jgi:hypothetical protein